MPPLFSIVTPCFNAAAALPRCVGSIRGQKGVTLEHIIQDGLSKDDTAKWVSGQPGLTFYSEKDRGMYDAINKGWAHAKGEILSWLNADEQYVPGSLASIAEVFRQNPDADVVYGDTIVVAPDGQPIAARREIPLRSAYVRNKFLYALSCSMFFHRRLLDEGLLKFDAEFRNAGDTDLVLRLLDAGRRCVQIRSYIGLFGVDGNNITISGTSKMDIELKRIRKEHHALPKPLRPIVMTGRYLERLAQGCYASDSLTYDFALDEKPTYRRFENVRTSSRFTYGRAVRKVQEMAQKC